MTKLWSVHTYIIQAHGHCNQLWFEYIYIISKCTANKKVYSGILRAHMHACMHTWTHAHTCTHTAGGGGFRIICRFEEMSFEVLLESWQLKLVLVCFNTVQRVAAILHCPMTPCGTCCLCHQRPHNLMCRLRRWKSRESLTPLACFTGALIILYRKSSW